MKIIRTVLCAALCLLLCLPVSAAEAAETVGPPATAAETASVSDAETGFFEKGMAWGVQYGTQLAMVGYLLYTVLPKKGLLSALRRQTAAVNTAVTAGNDTISRFMNDVYPRLSAVQGELEALRGDEETRRRQTDAMIACRQAVELMAKEFCTLLEISDGADDRKKTEIYAAWARGRRQLEERMQAAATPDTLRPAERAGDGI